MERDEWLRVAWRATVAREITTEQLVFVDEMGTNTSLHPLYAWSKRGQRPRCSAKPRLDAQLHNPLEEAPEDVQAVALPDPNQARVVRQDLEGLVA